MPSFKERFRPSRKYKKNKEGGTAGTDESANPAAIVNASGTTINTNNVSTTGTSSSILASASSSAAAAAAGSTTSTTIDEHTGSAALSTYHSYYSSDQCK